MLSDLEERGILMTHGFEFNEPTRLLMKESKGQEGYQLLV